MSRIHEALKRAEQERAASQTAPKSERQPEHACRRSTRSKPRLLRQLLPQAVMPQPRRDGRCRTHPGPLQFENCGPSVRAGIGIRIQILIVFENANPFFPGAEQFRTLRSRLYRMRESQPLQTILISSAIPAEGKTLVSTNLAYALVRQHGCRVLLIDADLRSPRVHTLLGAPSAPGLADYLQKHGDGIRSHAARQRRRALLYSRGQSRHASFRIDFQRSHEAVSGSRPARVRLDYHRFAPGRFPSPMPACSAGWRMECSSSFAPIRLLRKRLKRPARSCGTPTFSAWF